MKLSPAQRSKALSDLAACGHQFPPEVFLALCAIFADFTSPKSLNHYRQFTYRKTYVLPPEPKGEPEQEGSDAEQFRIQG